ncbi:MAG: NAD kinase [Xanthobacteraceae bacterium]|nr:NAD kinase [Xanthobacteraceae bacterium]
MTNAARSYDRIAFVASTNEEAEAARKGLAARYGDHPVDQADVVVALGGDGLMLQTLHRLRDTGVPIYGMNHGSVGFLMNEFRVDELKERLAQAEPSVIHPLIMQATDAAGKSHRAPAINEVSLLRQSYQAAKLELSIDGKVRLKELICDGVLVATPAGSSAYNLSAHGPILPLNAPLLALTPISPFRPRRWRGALLPNHAHIEIKVLEADKRPVNAVADHFEVRSVIKVSARMDPASSMVMLFDPGHSLDERILAEQFGD